MANREEMSEDLLQDVNGGLSAGDIVKGAKELAGDYLDNRLSSVKVPMGVLGNVSLELVKDAAETLMEKATGKENTKSEKSKKSI